MARLIIKDQDKSLAVQLEDHLQNNKEDLDLDLSNNALGKKPLTDLLNMVNVLEDKPTRFINLSSTGLQLKTAAELILFVNSFQKTNITSMNLANNWLGVKHINEDLVSILAELKNTKIRDINLDNNALGQLPEPFFIKLLIALQASNLDKISINANQLNYIAGAHRIAELLDKYLGNKVVLLKQDTFSIMIVEHMEKLAAPLLTTPDPNVFFQPAQSARSDEPISYGTTLSNLNNR